MGLGDVVNELHDKHSLADTSTAEKTDLTTLGVGGEQIDDLDTSHEDLIGGTLLSERGRGGVDGVPLVRVDGTLLVDGVTDHVDDAAKSGGAD